MAFVICGAKTRSGEPCNRPAVAHGKRCHIHGGNSPGATTPMGKLLNGLRLAAVRINGPGPGHKKTNKTKLRRIAAAKRLKAWREREPIRWKRAVRWENRKRIKLGLPLIDVEQLDKSSTPDEGESR